MNNLSTTMAVVAVNHNHITNSSISLYSRIVSILKNIMKYVFSESETNNYGIALEAYIISNNPQTPHDIELLEREFERKRRDLDIYTHLH